MTVSRALCALRSAAEHGHWRRQVREGSSLLSRVPLSRQCIASRFAAMAEVAPDAASALSASPPLRHTLTITVGEPERHGDGIGAFVAYKVHTATTMPLFRAPEATVRRRFRNFLWLYDRLVDTYPGTIVHPPPKKNFMGKFASEDSGFVERRRGELERFLHRIAAHPSLRESPDLRMFLESNEELPDTAVGHQSPPSMMKIARAITGGHAQAPKMQEDEWFDMRLMQAEELEAQLKQLFKSFEVLADRQKALAASTGALAATAAELSKSEDSPALAAVLLKFSEVERGLEGVTSGELRAVQTDIGAVISDYLLLLSAVRVIFHQRRKAQQACADASAELQRRRENEQRLRSSGKIDKLAAAEQLIHEGEEKCNQTQAHFEAVSSRIRSEIHRFDREKVAEFKAGVSAYVAAMVESQNEVIRLWEAFIPQLEAPAST